MQVSRRGNQAERYSIGESHFALIGVAREGMRRFRRSRAELIQVEISERAGPAGQGFRRRADVVFVEPSLCLQPSAEAGARVNVFSSLAGSNPWFSPKVRLPMRTAAPPLLTVAR